ncbi:IclR family transcriptional regulator [Mangrovactinospora gilvigrisea]|uniref:IclR family transcriptional regulator n=1 Tax=Mangrovactinospora gilvigrisea TaxID=1428644 RepID=A0A1J7CCM4_9ACTN|nr:IclR family transcriptional regulator [Mangrovactinospora gilvigrisea]
MAAGPRTPRRAGQPETSQTLDRGLSVLRLLAEEERGLTVGDLAERLGVNRTVVYRLLATLEQHRLVRRGPDNRFRLGLGLIRLAGRAQPLLSDAALPVLRAFTEDFGVTAHLTVADGDEGLVVAVEEPAWSDVHVAYRVGLRRPLSCGAAGAAIAAARRGGGAGCAVAEEMPGVRGVAAAVRGVAGVEAALGVVLLGEAVPRGLAERLVEGAERLSVALR